MQWIINISASTHLSSEIKKLQSVFASTNIQPLKVVLWFRWLDVTGLWILFVENIMLNLFSQLQLSSTEAFMTVNLKRDALVLVWSPVSSGGPTGQSSSLS